MVSISQEFGDLLSDKQASLNRVQMPDFNPSLAKAPRRLRSLRRELTRSHWLRFHESFLRRENAWRAMVAVHSEVGAGWKEEGAGSLEG